MTAPNFPKPPGASPGKPDPPPGKAGEKPSDDQTWLVEASRFEELALLALEHGEFREAASLFLHALKRHEEHDNDEAAICVAQYLGVSLYEFGREDAAVAIWEEMLARDCAFPTVFGLLLQHYESTGQAEEVARIYKEFRKSDFAMSEPPRTASRSVQARTTPKAEDTSAGGSSPSTSQKQSRASDTKKPSTTAPVNGNHHLIVLAENDPTLRKVFSRYLRTCGYLVLDVGDGESALSAIRRVRPDLALMDVYMPKQSGLDVLYRLRAADLDTEVILISGVTDETIVHDSAVLGAQFLTKPIPLKELREVIRARLEQRAT